MDTGTLEPIVNFIMPYVDLNLALACALITAFVLLLVKITNNYIKIAIPIGLGAVMSLISQLSVFPTHVSIIVGACSGLAAAMGTAYIIQLFKKVGNPNP